MHYSHSNVHHCHHLSLVLWNLQGSRSTVFKNEIIIFLFLPKLTKFNWYNGVFKPQTGDDYFLIMTKFQNFYILDPLGPNGPRIWINGLKFLTRSRNLFWVLLWY